MKFKVTSFRHDRISGWVSPGKTITTPTKVQLFVDGTPAGEYESNRFRSELKTGEVGSRSIGFQLHVPFQYWDGSRHLIELKTRLRADALARATMTLPDVRLSDNQPWYGHCAADPAWLIYGWVELGRSTTRVTLSIDGEEIEKEDATRPFRANSALNGGFAFVIPARYFDDKAHAVDVRAYHGSSMVTLLELRKTLRSADAPRVEGWLSETGEGSIKGAALHPLDIRRPVKLSLRVNGVTRLTTRTDPSRLGEFQFDTSEMAGVDLTSDVVNLRAEPYGARLANMPENILVHAVRARRVTGKAGNQRLVLESALPLRTRFSSDLSGSSSSELRAVRFDRVLSRYAVSTADVPPPAERAVKLGEVRFGLESGAERNGPIWRTSNLAMVKNAAKSLASNRLKVGKAGGRPGLSTVRKGAKLFLSSLKKARTAAASDRKRAVSPPLGPALRLVSIEPGDGRLVDETSVLASLRIVGSGCSVHLPQVLPARSLYLSVGAQSFELVRRVEGEHYYADLGRVIDGPLVLAEAARPGETSYDLRIGSPNGMRPGGLAERVPIDRDGGAVHADGFELRGGVLRATIYSTIPDARFCKVHLIRRNALQAGVQTLETESFRLGTIEAPKVATFPLPDDAFSGEPMSLGMLLERPDGVISEIWTADLQATLPFLETQLESCLSLREAVAFMRMLARSGHVASLADLAKRASQRWSEFSDRDVLEIVATALVHDNGAQLPPALQTDLTTLKAAVSEQEPSALGTLKKVLLTAEPVRIRGRYTTSPLAESLVDTLQANDNGTAEIAAQSIGDAISAKRYALAQSLYSRSLKTHGNAVAAQGARLALARGDYEACEALAREVLATKGDSREARLLLARTMARQGRALEAIAVLTYGQGLSAWRSQVPVYDHLKLTAKIDWPGALRRSAQAVENFRLVDETERSRAISGGGSSLQSHPYSIFFFGPAPPGDYADLFMELTSHGRCTQIAVPEHNLVSGLECTGEWAFVFKRPGRPDHFTLQSIFEQLRSEELVAKIVECRLDDLQLPVEFSTVGALLHVSLLTAFGHADFDAFLSAAEAVLRVKTVLIDYDGGAIG